ncbi:hypothetical protein P700755_002439 [Psychroflexus torquis ATCC 700755]|uniref:Uncharacterized protein n=1 Tax=Psychroflexus torquis (strain ATCC 700755 / CIP 106069 / ACAM 623) TaxID=313595 RepID=K4IUQ3_PSYTT|nr:hypothetical protein [Psychroflexus torquis]AFU69205.1 hypothetical protein P700755_002439 [Psychroflexus torquis ATCC 700755]
MNCPSQLNEVIYQVDKYAEVWEQLIQQLNKDIALVGLTDIELQTKITPEELWNGLQPIFSELMHKRTASFIHLLYRIDIHEKEIQDLMRHDDFLERLVYRVVERSFQKIYWRSVYM